MTFSVADFRRRMLSGALLAAVAASALNHGGTLACLAAWTLVSMRGARCRYPYKRRRGAYRRVLVAYLTFACVFLALTALLSPVLPPLPRKSGAAVFGVCAAADAARIPLSRKQAGALCAALIAAGAYFYAR